VVEAQVALAVLRGLRPAPGGCRVVVRCPARRTWRRTSACRALGGVAGGDGGDPRDLLGKTLAEARDELAAVGFHTIAVESADGRPIAGDPASTVVAVGGPGAVVPLSTTILLRVGDPPTAAPRVTAPVTEPPATTQADTPRAIPPTAPPPRPGASSPTTTTTATEVVYYRNCGQVRRAGAAPLHIGRPGYRPELDKDGDGVACDKDKDK
jgi:hypothetical protein